MLSLCLLLCFLQSEPADTAAPRLRPTASAEIAWLDEEPAAGEMVYLRLRGEALANFLDGRGSYRVMQGEQELSASMMSPGRPYEPVPFEIPFQQQSGPNPGELQLILDRGENPRLLSRLTFVPATTELTSSVRLERSSDKLSWNSAGNDQLIYWKMQDGMVWDYCEVEVQPRDERYIRLTFPGQSGLVFSSVLGWQTYDGKEALYEVPVTLGPMRAGEDGQHIWPLVMEQNNLPLVKLKVSASNAELLRRMNLVRLGEDQNPERNFSVLYWLNDIARDGLSRSGKWFKLDAETDRAPMAIVVEDGESPPLQLSGVQAYAGEMLISFAMPASTAGLRLEMLPDPQQGLVPSSGSLPPDAVISAEVSSLKPLASAAGSPAAGNPLLDLIPANFREMLNWALPLSYALLSAIALIWGLSLLRPQREEG